MNQRKYHCHRFNPFIIVFIFLSLFFGNFSKSLHAEKKVSSNVFFPLHKGSYWIYKGQTEWTEVETQNVVEKNVSWKMQVTDVVEREGFMIAVVKGHPQDLAWYEEGKTPGDYLIIQSGNKYYLIEGEDRVQSVLKRAGDHNDSLAGLVEEEEEFLETPLAKWNAFGAASQLKRGDHWYCWFVEDENQIDLKRLKGNSLSGPQTQYRLILRTFPDHTIVDFVPGIGITHYIYNHHGTVAKADLSLVEYSAE